MFEVAVSPFALVAAMPIMAIGSACQASVGIGMALFVAPLLEEAFGGKGFFIEEPKDLKGALQEAMDFRGPFPDHSSLPGAQIHPV